MQVNICWMGCGLEGPNLNGRSQIKIPGKLTQWVRDARQLQSFSLLPHHSSEPCSRVVSAAQVNFLLLNNKHPLHSLSYSPALSLTFFGVGRNQRPSIQETSVDLNPGHQDKAPSFSLTLKVAIIGDNCTRHLLTLHWSQKGRKYRGMRQQSFTLLPTQLHKLSIVQCIFANLSGIHIFFA